MRIFVNCPKCKSACVKLLDKTLSTNKDILFQCPNCKYIIPIRIYKTKNDRLWSNK